MNQTMELLLNRKSVRVYEEKEVSAEAKEEIIAAALRAPTAGNLMLYSIIEVTEQSTKDRLVTTCDNQPFIAKAPFVLLFLADYQRWYDIFQVSGVEQLCEQNGIAISWRITKNTESYSDCPSTRFRSAWCALGIPCDSSGNGH